MDGSKRIWRHLSFWFLYFAFEVYAEFGWMSAVLANRTKWDRIVIAMECEVMYLVVKVTLVYCSFAIIRHFGKGRIQNVKAAALLAGVLALAVLIHRCITVYVVLPFIYYEPGGQHVADFSFVISAMLDLIFIMGVANGVKQYRLQLRLKADKEQLVRETLSAELSLLKAQTNPHFLFNTLNNIYALARKHSDKTADVVMRLSKLLRFMLYESGAALLPLQREIKVIEDYIELERIRYSDRLSIVFNKTIDDVSAEITPLVLLPFVENAFKHGAGETRFDSFVHVALVLQEGMLLFRVENNCGTEEASEIAESREKMGLKGVRRQLQLLYREHELTITREKDIFIVNLTIDLNSYVAL